MIKVFWWIFKYFHQKRNDAINKVKFGDDDPIVKTKRKVDTFDVITQRYAKLAPNSGKEFLEALYL